MDKASLTIQEDKKRNEHSAAYEAKRFVTKGWWAHNEGTYLGVNWILNSSIGVAMAFWAGRTKSGLKYFSEPITTFWKAVVSPFQKNPALLNEAAKWGNRIIGIIIGGFTIIPLMIVLESKKCKKAIVRFLDEHIYGKAVIAKDPRFEESYKRIDDEPKKNFAAGLLTRAIALTPIFIFISTPANKAADKYVYQGIGNVTKWMAKTLRIQPKKMMSAASIKEGQTDWEFLHQTIGFDISTTFFYALIYEPIYKAITSFMKTKEKHKAAHVNASAVNYETTDIATDTPLISMTTKINPKVSPQKVESHIQAVVNSKQLGPQALTI